MRISKGIICPSSKFDTVILKPARHCSTRTNPATSLRFEWQPYLHHNESIPTDGSTMLRQHAVCGYYNKHKTALNLRQWLSRRRHRERGLIHRQNPSFSWFPKPPPPPKANVESVITSRSVPNLLHLTAI